MCVIVYKPSGVKAPTQADLHNCFLNNPDGAGYMLPINNKVVIRKGFMTYEDFEKDIKNTIKVNNLDPIDTPIVMHFRISTQGGVNKALCHPYPICESYDEMRKLESKCNLGLAHNGIISLTSQSEYVGGHYDNKKRTWVSGTRRKLDYNDTMTFIKDYASLIIDGDQYFARNDKKCRLLKQLIGYSKLAIMNRKGFVKLIGDFVERNGNFYSNTYSFEPAKSFTKLSDIVDDEWDGIY